MRVTIVNAYMRTSDLSDVVLHVLQIAGHDVVLDAQRIVSTARLCDTKVG